MYKVLKFAKNLPNEWDVLCKNNIYMNKNFLSFMEEVNYCNQSYYLFYDDNNKLYACFMMFERKFNLFIFTKLKINCKMKFIYLPLSVSHPSFVFEKITDEIEEVLNKLKGIKILINTQNEEIKNFHKGHYLPICILENKWNTFDEYMKNLRAHYRRRFNQALKKGQNIEFELLENNKNFNNNLYSFYEQVFNKSEYSLEKLNLDFFKNDLAKTVILKIDKKEQGFIQIIKNKVEDMLIFEFTGYNYEVQKEYDLYINMLLYMIKYGIENNFKYIQLGQTAYDAKLKTGAKMYYNYFLLSHSNKFLNYLIKKNINFLEYKIKEYNFNVFNN